MLALNASKFAQACPEGVNTALKAFRRRGPQIFEPRDIHRLLLRQQGLRRCDCACSKRHSDLPARHQCGTLSTIIASIVRCRDAEPSDIPD